MGDGIRDPQGSGSDDARCPGCGQAVAASARFCPDCGTPQVRVARSASPAGERRRLTILFCDLVGSTALSEQLDPEELGELVLAYQEMGRAVVHRFGGHVAQYLGDGLLAYFGYPTAHEDDAERAVLAGLAVLEGLDALDAHASARGFRLEARVGIHAGPAVVGEMGSADRSDTSAFGSTPNIAARIESVASAGTVALSDDVRRFLDPRFELVDRGTPSLKGVSQPIRIWEVVAVGERAPRSHHRTDLPMIGRAEELATLVGLVDEVGAGRPRIALVVAEPGLGKSRLLQALRGVVEDRGDAVIWFEGQCSALTSSTPLAPVTQFIRRELELDDAPDDAARQRLLADALAVLGDDAADAARRLGPLLGIGHAGADPVSDHAEESPELRRRRLLDALAAWVRALGTDATVVIAVEDLHWSDATTRELIHLLVELPPPARVLCVCTSRPEVELPWREHDDTVCIELAHLGLVEAEALTRLVATGHGLGTGVVDQLALRSDGVPLFIEELVHAAAESDLTEAESGVPLTLQALLASRLDLLGESRAVAQAAAVLGREFPRELLARVVDLDDEALGAGLERLVDARVLTYRQSHGRAVYAFRHALIQDAAYDSLLRRRRRALHDATARELMTGFADLVADSPGVVAHHLLLADRRLESAAWFETAGRRAAERAALVEARAHFDAGIAAIEPVEASRARSQQMLDLHMLLGNTLMGSSGIGNDVGGPVWERAIGFAEEVENAEEVTAALNGLAMFHADRGEIASTEACVDRILAIAEREDSRIGRLRGYGTRGLIRFYQARGQEAYDDVMHARSLSREGDFFTVTLAIGHDQETYFHTMGSWAAWWIGRPDECLALARAGLDTALRLPSSLSQALGRHGLTIAHHLRNEPAEAAAAARENLDLAIGLDFPYWRGIIQMELGTQLARLGDPSGIPMLEDGLDHLSASGQLSGGAFGMSMLALAYLAWHRYEDAIAAVDLGLATGALVDQPFCDTELLALNGRALIGSGRHDEGRARLEESLETGRRQGAASATLQTAIVLAPLVALDGPDRARALLTDALGAMADGADSPDQRAARAQLQQIPVPG